LSAVTGSPGRDTSQDKVKLIGHPLLCEIPPVPPVAQPQVTSAAPTTSQRACTVSKADMAHLRAWSIAQSREQEESGRTELLLRETCGKGA
jgi:hypothetical protein